jgi:integrase/recombinase XerD
MTEERSSYSALTLYSAVGERKYLNFEERKRFLAAIPVLKNEKDQTYCEMLFWSGCRPCEALDTCAIQIDLDECLVVLRSAKKRGKWKGKKFRPVPLPSRFVRRLDRVHEISSLQTRPDRGENNKLWTMCRTTAWSRIKTVCEAAGLSGIRACGRGLRHGFGTGGALNKVEPSQLQSMMGHEDYRTTATYLDVMGSEKRKIASRMWTEFGSS